MLRKTLNPRRAKLAALALAGFLCATARAGEIYEYPISRGDWPAAGHLVAALPAVRAALQRFDEHEKITVVIRYPGGDVGREWGDELHSWFVSFGIPIGFIEMEPGAGAADRLVVTIIDAR